MKKIFGAALAALISAVMIGTAIPAYAGSDITAERFEAAFKDNYTGYYYRNLTNMDKFVSALEDGYTVDRYNAIMERSRFAALREDAIDGNGAPNRNIDLLAAPAAANAVMKASR